MHKIEKIGLIILIVPVSHEDTKRNNSYHRNTQPPLTEQYGVETIGVFGSYRRGQQTKKSDIDILVTFKEEDYPGLFKFLELEEFLAKKLGVKVDLVSKQALKPILANVFLRK